MKNRFHTLVLGLLISMGLQAQVDNSLGLQWGVGSIIKQDMIFTPMIHKQISPLKVRLDYTRSGKVEQNIEVLFSAYSTSLTDQFQYYWDDPLELEESGKHSFTLLSINYKLGKKLLETEKFELSAGVRVRNRLNVATYTYGIDWLGHFGYYLAFGMDAYTDMNYTFSEKHAINMSVALPMFSMVSRSPYMSQNAEYFNDNFSHSSLDALFNFISRSTLQSWGSSQIADLKLGYSYTISEKLDLNLSYLFAMDINKAPKKLTQFENSVFVGVTYKFK